MNNTRNRVIVALAVASFGMWLARPAHRIDPQDHSDFSVVWFGAKALLAGRDPYALMGPGLEFNHGFHQLYPATAMVAAMPFAWLSEEYANVAFVGISTFLLAFGCTKKGWYLLPMFANDAYRSSAVVAQWTILFTAAVFLPSLAVLLAAKPQAGVPVVTASRDGKAVWYAALGGVALLLMSLFFLPSWPREWLRILSGVDHMPPAIFRPFGFLVLLCLFKWRRPEAWIILTLACVPQTMYWYNALILFTVPGTLIESLLFAAVSTVGLELGSAISPHFTSLGALQQWVGGMVVLSFYLPATVLVLRRPNEGCVPWWLRHLRRGASVAGENVRRNFRAWK